MSEIRIINVTLYYNNIVICTLWQNVTLLSIIIIFCLTLDLYEEECQFLNVTQFLYCWDVFITSIYNFYFGYLLSTALKLLPVDYLPFIHDKITLPTQSNVVWKAFELKT